MRESIYTDLDYLKAACIQARRGNTMLWKRQGDGAVSEIVGNLLILVITVALFSVVLTFVYSIPGPEATITADIVPMLERTSAVDGTLHLQHTGGEPLKEGETYILVSIDDTPHRFEISDGLPGGKTTMEPGDTWSMDFLGTVSTAAKLDVKIVDVTSNSLLFYTVVQRGVSSSGDHDPIIAYAWADSTVPGTDVLPNNDYTTWRLYAVCKDIDGDLAATGSVTASINSIDNGDGTFTVDNFLAGATAMIDTRGDGVYITGLLKVDTDVLPGDYAFTVTATDDTGRTATATVRVTVSTSFSSIREFGTDEAPGILKSGQSNRLFLKLELLANGESINVNGIRVRKLGTIPDNKVTIRAWWDKDRDGTLDYLEDYYMPGSGGNFIGGYRDFIGSPLFTTIEDEPTYVWFEISVSAGTEGFSVGLRIESQTSTTCIGVSTPIRILPIGSFPIDSSVLTIKGVFKAWGVNRQPSRILTNTDDVRIIELYFVATGETVFLHQLNLTLLGTIDTADITCYLEDEFGNSISGPAVPFNPLTRRLEFNAPPGGWKVDKAWSDYRINVYFNIDGNNGDTVGVRVDTSDEVFAITEVSGDSINPQSPFGEPYPNPPNIRTLAASGFVTLDREGSTTIPTRAGDISYQRRWLYRCYGEPIEFYSINVTLGGTISYDEITGVRIRVASASPVAIVYDKTITFDSGGNALFDSGVPGVPMWTVQMNADFYGYVRVDSYIYLDHGTEGDTVVTGIAQADHTELVGQITTTSIIPGPYGGGDIPTWSYTRTVNGQLYVHGEGLIPDPLVDSSQNVPVFRITLNAEGQSVRINSVVVNKLGVVAGNLVTVRMYIDANNDTFTKLGPDDVEPDPTDAGNFVANAITFTPPNLWVTPGVDLNLIVVFSLNLGTAGWTLGCSINAGAIGTTTALPNLMPAYPNMCLNLPRNPPMVVQSDTVPIRDRGNLTINMEDLSPPNPTESTPYVWMKLTFWAEGENVDVNRIAFTAYNISSGPADWTRIRIVLFKDVNNNSAYDPGGPTPDIYIADEWFDIFGEAEFQQSPLFELKQRVAFNVLVLVLPQAGSHGNFTLAINTTSDVQSKGQVSGLSVMPIASFPLTAVEREIVP